MIKLGVENFRSIKKQAVELAPITVFYGPNGSGKSSLLYSLILMKNVILNLERQSGDFYNFGFANLGDFRAVIHGHDLQANIKLHLEMKIGGSPVLWGMQILNNAVNFTLHAREEGIHYDFAVIRTSPYTSFDKQEGMMAFRETQLEYLWEGIGGYIGAHTDSPDEHSAYENVNRITNILNAAPDLARSIAIAPLQMAFSTVAHTVKEDTSLHSTLYFSEDQVGTLLATRRYLQSPVSHYLEKVTGRTLRVFSPPGTTEFSINVENRDTGFETELINDGYGVNRIAWLLTLTLHDETKWMCIEEPETHLHPSAIRKLIHTFVDIIHNEEKRFLLTTHSETLVLALLSEVARGNLKPDDVAFYLTSKEGKETEFERQEVNEHGQVEGGLASFMEGELEDLATFFERAN